MDKRVLLTVFVAVGLALGVALLAFGVFMWPWHTKGPTMTDQPTAEPMRTTERLTASENKSLDVVVSIPAEMTLEPVAPSADPGSQGTPPAEVND